MVKEYNVHEALANYPQIRNSIPKELLREITKDEEYIIRIDTDKNIIEIGYPEDKEWALH